MADARLRPGDVLGGYRIERLLGEGGMGAVCAAVQVATGARRALKVPFFEGDPDQRAAARARFVREAQILAALELHPHVVRIHALGEDAGRPFCVLEMVEGESLASIVKRGALPVERAVALAIEVARALEHLHRAGVLHRDLKPANVLVRKDGGGAVLVDFGLARDAASEKERLTKTGTVLGTPAYMAPEQVEGASDVDARADVYGLGATLFELLTGAPPFAGDNPVNVIKKVLMDSPARPSSVRAEVPRALDDVVLRAMEKDRRARFESANALREALERVPRGEARSRSPVVPAAIAIVVVAVASIIIARSKEPAPPPPRLAPPPSTIAPIAAPRPKVDDALRALEDARKEALETAASASLARTIDEVKRLAEAPDRERATKALDRATPVLDALRALEDARAGHANAAAAGFTSLQRAGATASRLALFLRARATAATRDKGRIAELVDAADAHDAGAVLAVAELLSGAPDVGGEVLDERFGQPSDRFLGLFCELDARAPATLARAQMKQAIMGVKSAADGAYVDKNYHRAAHLLAQELAARRVVPSVGHDLPPKVCDALRSRLFEGSGDPGELLADVYRAGSVSLSDRIQQSRFLWIAERDRTRPDEGWDDDVWWKRALEVDEALEKRLASYPEDWGAKLARAALSRDIVALHFERVARNEPTRQSLVEIDERARRSRKDLVDVIALGECLPNPIRVIAPVLLHNFTGYLLTITAGKDPEGDLNRLRDSIEACETMHGVPWGEKYASTAFALEFQIYVALRARDRDPELEKARVLGDRLATEAGGHPKFHIAVVLVGHHLVRNDLASAEKFAAQAPDAWQRGLLHAIVVACDPARRDEAGKLVDADVIANLPADRADRRAALFEARNETDFIGAFDRWKDLKTIYEKLSAAR